MTGPSRHGLTVPLHAHTLAEMGPIAREAEELGYTDLWSEAFLRWLGMGELIGPVLERWRGGDRAAALDAMSDELLRGLLVIGDVDACRARIAEYVEAGVRVPCVAPFSGRPDREAQRGSIRAMVRALAP